MKKIILITLGILVILTPSVFAVQTEDLLRLTPEKYPLINNNMQTKVLLDQISSLTPEQSRAKILNEGKDRLQVALWMVSLANTHMKTHTDDGVALLKHLAYNWHHPLALILYSKILSYDAEKIKSIFPSITQIPKQDKEEAFILMNLAFDMVGADFKLTQNKELLNITMNMGLGLSDSFYGDVVNNRFNAKDTLLKNQQRYMESMKKYTELYLTATERSRLTTFDYLPIHWNAHHGR